MNDEDKGLRFNQGKTRHDLTPAFAQEQYARVLTHGSVKYAERNWELGMKWSKDIASMERHLQAIKRGEDYDKESGLLHSAHVMCNAAFLTEYYKIYPQGDDRPTHKLITKRIGLDIDEVLADFTQAYSALTGAPLAPMFWNFDPSIKKVFETLAEDDRFWREIKPKISPDDLPFEPVVYISTRPIPTTWTAEWLFKNGFPSAPIIHTTDKVAAVKDNDLDAFVDDSYDNFVRMRREGILCYLMDAPHNRRYDVGFYRIKSLREIVEY